MIVSRQLLRTAFAVASLVTGAVSQTWTICDPTKTTCPPNAALGMSINVDFTKGSVNSFLASGGTPTYGSDGVTFSVAKSGDAPQLGSVFYIMFGHVEVTMKCAPGAGIVSSLVLQSDDLDEIDFEWLGADNAQVQTNYFGKGKTDGFNRGQFHANANNQGQFLTYAIDWTPDRIVWSIGGTEIRTLKFDDAKGQYPQTPMQIKFGAWSGGDPANPPGTIEWAKGPTDYTKGPFSMAVKSAKVTDYSTGKQYKWGDMSGTWQSIVAVDGKINGNAGSKGSAPTLTATAAQPSTTNSPTVPVGGIGRGSSTTTITPMGSLPSGWVMTSSGKMIPASSTSDLPLSSSSPGPSGSLPSPAGSGELTTLTTTDARGSPTTMVTSTTTMVTSTTPGNSPALATAAPPVGGGSSRWQGVSHGWMLAVLLGAVMML